MRKYLLCTSALAFAMSATAVSAADLGVGEIVEAPAYVAEGFSWNGVYFGGSVGYAWHDRDDGELCDTTGLDQNFGTEDILEDFFFIPDAPDFSCFASDAEGDTDDTLHIFEDGDDSGSDDGWMASGFLGVNRQYGQLVVGTELEGVWMDSNGSSNSFFWIHKDDESTFIEDFEILAFGEGAFETDGPDWMAQGTAKAGFLMGSRNQALLYIKGGFAAADKQESSFDGFGESGEDFDGVGEPVDLGDGEFLGFLGNETEDSGYGFGGTIGAGLEYKLTQNFSIGAEYQATFLNYTGSHDINILVRDEGNGEIRESTLTNPFGDILIHAVKAKATLHFN
jgi:opacity protein-like surface antigen